VLCNWFGSQPARLFLAPTLRQKPLLHRCELFDQPKKRLQAKPA